MSNIFSIGDVVWSNDGGEVLLYGWLDFEEVIKAIEDFFDEPIDRSEIKDVIHEYWKFVPCRNDPDGYPGLYYQCNHKTRGAIKGTRVIFKQI